MEPSFWRDKWAQNSIGFHRAEANPLLVEHFHVLNTPQRVLIPLCGKTRDIAWLLEQGHQVVGVELVEMAIVQLFEELDVDPTIAQTTNHKHYSAPNLDIFVGDVFDVDAATIGPIDAIYDRAALVALPQEMRDRYTRHMVEVTNNAPQLLITFIYDQSLMSGPPFSISEQEVTRQYSDHYQLTSLHNKPISIKGEFEATEQVWHLSKS